MANTHTTLLESLWLIGHYAFLTTGWIWHDGKNTLRGKGDPPESLYCWWLALTTQGRKGRFTCIKAIYCRGTVSQCSPYVDCTLWMNVCLVNIRKSWKLHQCKVFSGALCCPELGVSLSVTPILSAGSASAPKKLHEVRKWLSPRQTQPLLQHKRGRSRFHSAYSWAVESYFQIKERFIFSFRCIF